MAANTNPIFIGTPDIQFGGVDGNGGTTGPLKTANTAYDGTGTVLTIFTADATNGGYVDRIRCKAAGTTGGTSVLRIFINNGSTNGTATNNVLWDEISLPSITASATNGTQTFELPVALALPAGYKINVTLGTTLSVGWYISAMGGKF